MGIILYTDGGARGNPGPAGIGGVLYDGGKRVAEFKRYIGKRTNNWAEYEALAEGVAEAKRSGFSGHALDIRMDSELIVRQMSGIYKVKDKNLKEQYAKVREALADFPGTRFTHVPREENMEADRLVNEAIDEASV